MQNLGIYNQYTCKIDDQAEIAFKKAMDGLLGVEYSPVAVSTQLVDGMNYKFFCNTRPSTMPSFNGAAIVSVYASIHGDAHITHIQQL